MEQLYINNVLGINNWYIRNTQIMRYEMEEFECYDEELCEKQELNKPVFKEIAEGDYKGIHWCIRTLGVCPLAYVSVPVEQQAKLESLVHGGLSFWNDKLVNKDDNRTYQYDLYQ